MSYLAVFQQITSALHAEMASGYCMSGGEETYGTWDAYLGSLLGLWTHCPMMSAILAPMTEADRWQFAGENCDDESGYSLAAMLDSECSVCGTAIGDHDAAQHYSCDAVRDTWTTHP